MVTKLAELAEGLGGEQSIDSRTAFAAPALIIERATTLGATTTLGLLLTKSSRTQAHDWTLWQRLPSADLAWLSRGPLDLKRDQARGPSGVA